MKKNKIKTLLSLCFLMFTTQVYCQTKKYTVTYQCFINNLQPLKAPDSILLVRNGDSSKIPWRTASKINIKTTLMYVKVAANMQTATITYTNKSSGWSIKSANKMDDSLLYSKNKWTGYKNGKSKNIPIVKERYLYGNNKKIILGYNCYKVFVKNSVGELDSELWVTDELPATIMPYSGSKPLSGAILQSKHLQTGITYHATNVSL